MCLGETRNNHGDSFVYDGKNFKIKTEASRRRNKRIYEQFFYELNTYIYFIDFIIIR
jgi:hypothetical protein